MRLHITCEGVPRTIAGPLHRHAVLCHRRVYYPLVSHRVKISGRTRRGLLRHHGESHVEHFCNLESEICLCHLPLVASCRPRSSSCPGEFNVIPTTPRYDDVFSALLPASKVLSCFCRFVSKLYLLLVKSELALLPRTTWSTNKPWMRLPACYDVVFLPATSV